MKSKIFLIALICAVAVSMFSTDPIFAQERLRYDDYQLQLVEWQQREEAAQARIQECEEEIAALRAQLDELNSEIEDVVNAIWLAIGMSEQEFESYLSELNSIREQINELLSLSPAELLKRQDEIANLFSRLDELAGERAARHPEAAAILRDLERLRSQLENALENVKPAFDIYSVMRGDNLWRIAEKPSVYSDPFQWIRIYTKNRDMISNPDLIFPGQEFKIFQDVIDNEHLVVRGEYLSKIAGYGDVYNDPFQWTRLYELNRSVIENQDLIYPHMILITR